MLWNAGEAVSIAEVYVLPVMEKQFFFCLGFGFLFLFCLVVFFFVLEDSGCSFKELWTALELSVKERDSN